MADPRKTEETAPTRSSARLLRGLLVVSAVLLGLTLSLSAHLVVNWRRIASTRAELLSRAELQAELLASRPSDMAVFPHDDPRIGYVLDPSRKEATWHGPEGKGYPVNSLGLRGEEIPPKPSGRTRILVVGDSVVFGWKLGDDDRLANHMARTLRASGAGETAEIFTIALPGWNVVSEHAFLENYDRRLQPDVVIWSIIPNDVFDIAGVVPPGRLQQSVSSQRRRLTPFTAASTDQGLAPLPSVLERWDRNLALVTSYRKRFGVPVVLLNFSQERLPLIQDRLERTGTELPIVSVPQSYFDDSRWRLTERDGHPTPWANSRLSVGLLARLATLGLAPTPAFESEDLATVRDFEAAAAPVSAQTIARFYEKRLGAVAPLSNDNQTGHSENAVYGLRSKRMAKNGLLFLRGALPARAITLGLSIPPGRPALVRRVSVEARALGGATSRESFKLRTGENQLHVPLPATDGREPVYELAWDFDLLVCAGALACDSGASLERVAFEPAPR